MDIVYYYHGNNNVRFAIRDLPVGVATWRRAAVSPLGFPIAVWMAIPAFRAWITQAWAWRISLHAGAGQAACLVC